MEYIVSARKYRPATFDSVVGQRALTTTLLNAIGTGKLAHAYLFCGPRGVGKTTCARIFAKTINCYSPTPQGEACQSCESCVSFDAGRSINIHELDAASNNSVDDIRELIDQVRIPPQGGRYKVFIIDEVHMLSTAAFNAFLKTLEEPPSHVIFILATTEKHKILPTILSRCQVYDFQRITLSQTVDHLQYIAAKEGVEADVQALHLIARKADGGMRDALSIFDQMASFTGGKITLSATLENLNMLDSTYYFRLTDMLLGAEISQAMLLLNEIISKGFDAGNFVSGLADHLRNLLLARDARTLPLLEVAADEIQRYGEQAARCALPYIYKALSLCQQCEASYRQSRNKRLLVEVTLIELSQLDQGDVPSSGPRPGNVLKPVFAALNQGGEETKEKRDVNSVAEGSPSVTGQMNVQSRADAGVRPLRSVTRPVLSLDALSISATASPVPAASEESTVQPPQSQSDSGQILSETMLRQAWNGYVNQLPQIEQSYANRLRALQPRLEDEIQGRFVIEAVNPLLMQELEQRRGDIERCMRQMVGIPQLSMRVVLAPPERRVVLSPQQRLLRMIEHNASLGILVREAKLELA